MVKPKLAPNRMIGEITVLPERRPLDWRDRMVLVPSETPTRPFSPIARRVNIDSRVAGRSNHAMAAPQRTAPQPGEPNCAAAWISPVSIQTDGSEAKCAWICLNDWRSEACCQPMNTRTKQIRDKPPHHLRIHNWPRMKIAARWRMPHPESTVYRLKSQTAGTASLTCAPNPSVFVAAPSFGGALPSGGGSAVSPAFSPVGVCSPAA